MAKPVVAVLMNGRPLALQWLADSVPAILESWFLGVQHGNAVADVESTPLWPFGFGLSYTTFDYSQLRAEPSSIQAGDSISISGEVTNRGNRTGEDVAQIYLRDDVASVAQPVRMLKGFQRLSLQPGETRTVKFALHSDDLALYDLSFRRVVEPGTFTIFAGGNSMATLQTRFEVTGHPAVLAPATPRPQ